jgi:hypothetical protein
MDKMPLTDYLTDAAKYLVTAAILTYAVSSMLQSCQPALYKMREEIPQQRIAVLEQQQHSELSDLIERYLK